MHKDIHEPEDFGHVSGDRHVEFHRGVVLGEHLPTGKWVSMQIDAARGFCDAVESLFELYQEKEWGVKR